MVIAVMFVTIILIGSDDVSDAGSADDNNDGDGQRGTKALAAFLHAIHSRDSNTIMMPL
jgi:hypothetical protein